MADGLNQARAMRVAEIMNDFRSLQYHLAAIPTSTDPAESRLEGHMILQACISEGQAVLAADYSQTSSPPRGNKEAAKEQLTEIILDAAARRFKCHRAYMRATAAHRWAVARQRILESSVSAPQASAQIQQLDQRLRANLQAMTDAHVEETLRAHDEAQGKYLDDDPTLEDILEHLEEST